METDSSEIMGYEQYDATTASENYHTPKFCRNTADESKDENDDDMTDSAMFVGRNFVYYYHCIVNVYFAV